jgi:nucleotide-binding universal stress UspA family protein
MIHKILLAIDGSASALNAADYAIELAKKTKSELEIVYIVRFAMGNIDAGILPMDIEEKEKERAIQLINKIKEEHEDVKIQDFETVGRPVKEINDEIKKWEADLLIIGHHTHSFFEKLFINSFENDLLKNLKIPLLTIPANYKC